MEILLDTLKWSAVVGAAALLMTALKPLLDRRYSPKWRYGAWLVLAVLLLAAPVQWERLLPRTKLAASAGRRASASSARREQPRPVPASRRPRRSVPPPGRRCGPCPWTGR